MNERFGLSETSQAGFHAGLFLRRPPDRENMTRISEASCCFRTLCIGDETFRGMFLRLRNGSDFIPGIL